MKIRRKGGRHRHQTLRTQTESFLKIKSLIAIYQFRIEFDANLQRGIVHKPM
jgi:hypothetical protein